MSEIGNTPSEVKTGKDLIQYIAACKSLPSNRRCQYCAAVRRAANWVRRTLDDFLMEPEAIAASLERLMPSDVGVSRREFDYTKSGLSAALRLVGLLPPRAQHVRVFLPDYMRIWEKATIYEKRQISRLFRMLSELEVPPDGFNEVLSAAFLKLLVSRAQLARARADHQNACRIWNRLIGRVPEITMNPVKVPWYLQTLRADEAVLPEKLMSEFEAFLALQTKPSYFDRRTPSKPLRARTIMEYRKRFRLYISALLSDRYTKDDLIDLRFLVQPAVMEVGLGRLLIWRGPECPESRHCASGCANLMMTIVRRWITGYPPDDLVWLKATAKKLKVETAGLSERVHARIKPFKHERNLAKLFLTPLAIAKRLAGEAEHTYSDALTFQIALALVIEMFCPLRVSNLAGLDMEKHFSWESPESLEGELIFELPAGVMKNDHPASLPVPKECADLIRIYIRGARKMFPNSKSQFLFTGDYIDRPKDANTLGKQMKRFIMERTNWPVNAHMYRHLVHIVVLNKFPGAYAMVARILTHTSIETAVRNYSYFDVSISMREYQKLVLQLTGGKQLGSAETSAAVAYGIDWESI